MEALDKEYQRNLRRLSKDVLEPAVANTYEQIKMLLHEFDPAHNRSSAPVSIVSDLNGVNQDGREVTYQVSADTKSKTKRDMLVEGFDILKQRIEAEEKKEVDEGIAVNGKVMKPAKIGTGVHSHSYIDPLIKQWLGGYRSGLAIRWDLDDGYTYEYDVYQHKLVRFKRDG